MFLCVLSTLALLIALKDGAALAVGLRRRVDARRLRRYPGLRDRRAGALGDAGPPRAAARAAGGERRDRCSPTCPGSRRSCSRATSIRRSNLAGVPVTLESFKDAVLATFPGRPFVDLDVVPGTVALWVIGGAILAVRSRSGRALRVQTGAESPAPPKRSSCWRSWRWPRRSASLCTRSPRPACSGRATWPPPCPRCGCFWAGSHRLRRGAAAVVPGAWWWRRWRWARANRRATTTGGPPTARRGGDRPAGPRCEPVVEVLWLSPMNALSKALAPQLQAPHPVSRITPERRGRLAPPRPARGAVVVAPAGVEPERPVLGPAALGPGYRLRSRSVFRRRHPTWRCSEYVRSSPARGTRPGSCRTRRRGIDLPGGRAAAGGPERGRGFARGGEATARSCSGAGLDDRRRRPVRRAARVMTFDRERLPDPVRAPDRGQGRRGGGPRRRAPAVGLHDEAVPGDAESLAQPGAPDLRRLEDAAPGSCRRAARPTRTPAEAGTGLGPAVGRLGHERVRGCARPGGGLRDVPLRAPNSSRNTGPRTRLMDRPRALAVAPDDARSR